MFCTPLPEAASDRINNALCLVFTYTDGDDLAVKTWRFHFHRSDPNKTTVEQALEHFMHSNPVGTVAKVEIGRVPRDVQIKHYVQSDRPNSEPSAPSA